MLAIDSWSKTKCPPPRRPKKNPKTKFPWYEEVTIQKDFSINKEGKTSFTLLFDRNMQERMGGLTVYPVLVKMWDKMCAWCSGKLYDAWILEWENWRGRHKTHHRSCLFWPTQIFLDWLLEIFDLATHITSTPLTSHSGAPLKREQPDFTASPNSVHSVGKWAPC